jgi:hypothetical protein
MVFSRTWEITPSEPSDTLAAWKISGSCVASQSITRPLGVTSRKAVTSPCRA